MIRTDITAMPVAERLQLMEALWESLADDAVESVIPDWHADVLAERESLREHDRERTIDWEQAKQRIRNRIAKR